MGTIFDMKITKLFLPFFFLLLIGFLPLSEAFLGPTAKAAWGPLSKNVFALSNEAVENLSRMIKGTGDVTKVKKNNWR